ncbi:hypothetical protein EV191_13211 [Tamaricihabitans halophyticus]|uniref:Uncharacterized protein n=1 Tax=Tamaricihabitans halophyticus TaxID=1262583 RepID=A0A4R2PY89_9PSEU|nr:hypothetical protein EV191_13211 [Tamaricihabitans halophyticus]
MFADKRIAVEVAYATLPHAAGNFYLDDKPTCSIVSRSRSAVAGHRGPTTWLQEVCWSDELVQRVFRK